jgi:hypothetical protein
MMVRKSMFSAEADESPMGEKLIFLSPVSSVPVFWLDLHTFHLGQHLQVDRIAFPVDLLLLDKLYNLAVRLFAVFTISESAAFLACLFKAGEIGGELLNRDVNHPEVIKAGRIDELTAIAEKMQCGHSSGVSTSFFSLAYLSGCEIDFREKAVEDGALADTRRANEYPSVPLAEKGVERFKACAIFGTQGENLDRFAVDLLD